MFFSAAHAKLGRIRLECVLRRWGAPFTFVTDNDFDIFKAFEFSLDALSEDLKEMK